MKFLPTLEKLMSFPMLASLIRGLPRILVMLAIGNILVVFSYLPELANIRNGFIAVAAPICFGSGLVFISLAVGDAALRVMKPKLDSQIIAAEGIRGNLPAAVVFLGYCILYAVIQLLMVSAARAESPPAAAVALLPILAHEQQAYWPAMPQPSGLGAQIEQETCPSLKHRMCWNPKAELRTSREQGRGLGQLTRTWNKDGSERFDALRELTQTFPKELKGLDWNSVDPTLQIRALVLKDLQGYRFFAAVPDPMNRWYMAASGYNGGNGAVRSDQRVCAATPGCDKNVWFGHVEHTSLKSKAIVPGYGKPFFYINREYVENIAHVRRPRYLILDRPVVS